MANKVKVLKNKNNNTYIVQAIPIQRGNEILFVPSPFGTETIVFYTFEEAVEQIKKYGYEYSVTESMLADKQQSNNIEYDQIIEVLIKNLGHENLEIRNTAINSLAKFNSEIADRLIEILKTNKHWLVQQSIVKCIEKIIEKNGDTISIFLPSLIEISNSENTMVKSAALKAIEKICDLKNNT